MITKDDVIKLASLSRLALTEKEKDSFLNEIDAILGYVANIKSLAESPKNIIHENINSLRDDHVIHGSNEYSELLLGNAPKRNGNYVSVKKILE